MRILVLSLPRTGSTSFSKKLAEEHSLSFVFEPFAPMASKFNKLKNFDTDYTKDDIIVKTLINDEFDINWYVNFSSQFNKVYLLSRKDINACVESWAFLNHKRNETPGFDFETEYYWEKTPNYDECYNQIVRWGNKLEVIASRLNQEILYYEDIFGYNNNTLRKGDRKHNNKLL